MKAPTFSRGMRRASRDRLAAVAGVAAAIEDLAIIIADRNGSIIVWNPGAQHLLGYHPSEMIGRTIADIEPPAGEPVCIAAGCCAMDQAGPIETERRYQHKSGRSIRCRSRRMPLGDDGALAWLVRDANPKHEQRPALEQRLREQQVQLDDALAANAARDRCLAVMSHELKQPLTALLLNLDRLLERTARMDVQGAQRVAQAMRDSIRRQARIIGDLLDLSRMRTGKLGLELAMVDLDEVVRAITADVAIAAPDRKIHMEVDASIERWCLADPVRLEQMLSNLLSNAVKFTGTGGRIGVCVTSVDGFARVSVADDGCGISPEFLTDIFRMYGQERRVDTFNDPGMGIGLALVQELAEAHGGRVEARSKGAGRGADFTIWLPLLSSAPRSLPVQTDTTTAPLPLCASAP
ncbi:PAS domain-containing sensor histidine kinase [Rhodanobacter sp. Root561]|uniref:PAS domain-containing sensor histidine kinase n=1 Tax=Rhodanobacter sp. Root561 TaxID=1736560 RepID=UPI000AE40B8F|nr:PAS domain-containing sensor histidine kinase [Rhodanobacter sp. Root561]